MSNKQNMSLSSRVNSDVVPHKGRIHSLMPFVILY